MTTYTIKYETVTFERCIAQFQLSNASGETFEQIYDRIYYAMMQYGMVLLMVCVS
jgi:hypothetical protein